MYIIRTADGKYVKFPATSSRYTLVVDPADATAFKRSDEAMTYSPNSMCSVVLRRVAVKSHRVRR